MMVDDARTKPKNGSSQVDAPEIDEVRSGRIEVAQSSMPDRLSHEREGEETNGDCAGNQLSETGVPELQNDVVKEQVSLPRKKRCHDEMEDNIGLQDDETAAASSPGFANARSERCGPEKKRCREEEPSDLARDTTPGPRFPDMKPEITKEIQHELSTDTVENPRGVTTRSFADTAFGQLSSKPSGFAAVQACQGNGFLNGFSSATPKFSSPTPAPSKSVSGASDTIADQTSAAAGPRFCFGSSLDVSPFAGFSSKVNGFSGFGSGPPSAFPGTQSIGNFSSGTSALQCHKVVKPFGAPDSDSDVNEEEDGDDEDGRDSEGRLDDKIRRASPEKDSEDRKRPKLHKIEVDDGEAGEITMVSVRAKMFSFDKQTGWKERGAGMLKINVPRACVEFDDSGGVIPGSFDASGLELDESPDQVGKSKVARLILRQDQTRRVILNTAILPAMDFQETASLKSVGILFTALEGSGATPVGITIRMSATSSKVFLNEVKAIQRELRGH
ncbi:hypothetical protein E4U17_001415 [Claviceps sp. LM77 group G4]|nr:hypothetical protein E4U17_001415 [Claviceps sp. LM77 group G4]